MAKVIITGVTGQDGSYMAELCLAMGHKVYGMVRRTAQIHNENYKHLLSNPNFQTVYGDLTDGPSIDALVKEVQPDYFINFAAQSFVGVSWRIPEATFNSCAGGVLKCLEAIRNYAPLCRFYNAGSSEQFGNVDYAPQDEKHPFKPRSPYGAAKAAAHHLVKVYRESYGLYAVQGLLFNHESERRGVEFVTRKITKGVARIKAAILKGEDFKPIELGNLYAKRDWSHAEDFMEGIWRMLNQETYNLDLAVEMNVKFGGDFDKGFPTLTRQEEAFKWLTTQIKDYVLSSNETHTINEFIELAFKHAGIDVTLINGTPLNSKIPYDQSYDQWVWKKGVGKYPAIVTINPEFYRPAEVDLLLGDSTKARQDLGWSPKNSFDKLAKRMVESDLNELGIELGSACKHLRPECGCRRKAEEIPQEKERCCKTA